MLMVPLEEDWGLVPRAGAAIDFGSAPGPSPCRICGFREVRLVVDQIQDRIRIRPVSHPSWSVLSDNRELMYLIIGCMECNSRF